MYDAPWVPKGTQKVFEAVAVVSDTAETLGALKWGVAIGRLIDAEPANCTDAPSVEFAAAVDRFYAAPANIGPDPERHENYDAILDGFSPDGAALTADHLKQLDPVAALLVATPTMRVLVAGFGDEHGHRRPGRVRPAGQGGRGLPRGQGRPHEPAYARPASAASGPASRWRRPATATGGCRSGSGTDWSTAGSGPRL